MHHGERFNSITHLVGAMLALVGLVVLVVVARLHGGVGRIVSVSIYGASLLMLYTFSTLYHSLTGTAKRVFQHLDHTAIYLLIAGTYTPLTLVVLGGRTGWSLFAAVWTLAVVGALQEFRRVKGERVLSVVIYLAMGWMAVFALGPLVKAIGPAGLAWIVGGGVCYTAGVGFYAFDRRLPVFHGVWHLFVLAGSLAHYVVVLAYAA
ncbi:MAG TPA: hemolysin III family protein [Vicinamibacterales bacterium]